MKLPRIGSFGFQMATQCQMETLHVLLMEPLYSAILVDLCASVFLEHGVEGYHDLPIHVGVT